MEGLSLGRFPQRRVLKGPKGVKWELRGFTYFWLGNWDQGVTLQDPLKEYLRNSLFTREAKNLRKLIFRGLK
jgi:hypothetical protein